MNDAMLAWAGLSVATDTGKEDIKIAILWVGEGCKRRIVVLSGCGRKMNI